MLTCYDAAFAKILSRSNALDYLLVGDSMGMVVYGEENTLGVSLRMMSEHILAVRKGVEASGAESPPQVIGDMVAGTYEEPNQALEAARIIRGSGADIVKIEGPKYDVAEALTKNGYRVCGHIGLTPQSIQAPKVQGREVQEAERLKVEALALQSAGCELLVIELVPAHLAKEITESLDIPTIGIGAGPDCSGQVLVLYDMLGLNPDFKPKFLKRFADGTSFVEGAAKAYADEVRKSEYPSKSHSFW